MLAPRELADFPHEHRRQEGDLLDEGCHGRIGLLLFLLLDRDVHAEEDESAVGGDPPPVAHPCAELPGTERRHADGNICPRPNARGCTSVVYGMPRRFLMRLHPEEAPSSMLSSPGGRSVSVEDTLDMIDDLRRALG